MVRTSLSVHARLIRAQAVRQKREAIEGAATQDAWTLHVAEQSMLKVADPDIERLEAARPKAAPVAAPAPHTVQRIEENVSEDNTNSQDVAFETWMSVQPWNQEPNLSQRLREAMAGSRLAGRELPAPGRESPGRTG